MFPLAHCQPFDFVYDRWNQDQPVPNLIDPDDLCLGVSQLAFEYPYIVPCRIEKYCQDHQYPVRRYRLDDSYPAPSFYPVSLSRFDCKIDYFALMSDAVRQHLRQGKMLALFVCHGHHDVMQQRKTFEIGVARHDLPKNCYRVLVNNTMVVWQVPWFYKWQEAELEYWGGNQNCAALPVHDNVRSHDFTILVRKHRPWRALVMAHLKQSGLLDTAQWSYGNLSPGIDKEPGMIDLSRIPDLTQQDINKFLGQAPYRADDIPLGRQRSLQHLVPEHFTDSYVHVVVETALEAQGGSILSDKIFKPIKHGQPFVVLGTQNNLNVLRHLGYRTFDKVLDNSYDLSWDHTQRYLLAYQLLRHIRDRGAREIFDQCLEDIEHNQKLFMSNKRERLAVLQMHLVFHFLYNNNDYGNFKDYHELRETLWHQH